MKKKIVSSMFLSFCSVYAAADVGIGVSVNSQDRRVYMPIDVSESFRIEPQFTYFEQSISVPTFDNDTEYTAFSLGLFKKQKMAENFNFFLGARIGYVQDERKTESDTSMSTSDLSGYSIAPTIGFEYYVFDKLSIGGEVAWSYTDLDGEEERFYF